MSEALIRQSPEHRNQIPRGSIHFEITNFGILDGLVDTIGDLTVDGIYQTVSNFNEVQTAILKCIVEYSREMNSMATLTENLPLIVSLIQSENLTGLGSFMSETDPEFDKKLEEMQGRFEG